MEAGWLFGVGVDKIKVLVHRQSVVHSMVEFTDNAVIAQLGAPDMKLPIQYALSYPQRFAMSGNELDLTAYQGLTFEEPDTETFPALKLAYEAGRAGGIMPTVFNGADEEAVELFLNGKLRYLEIAEVIEKAMREMKNVSDPGLETILEADRLAREFVKSI